MNYEYNKKSYKENHPPKEKMTENLNHLKLHELTHTHTYIYIYIWKKKYSYGSVTFYYNVVYF